MKRLTFIILLNVAFLSAYSQTNLKERISFAPESHVSGGFFANPSVGLQYPLKNKIKLQLAIGYECQKLKLLKKQAGVFFLKEFEEVLNHNSFTIKIGAEF